MVVQLPQAPEVGILEGEPRADVTATGAGALQCLLPGFVGNSFLGLASEPTGTENTTRILHHFLRWGFACLYAALVRCRGYTILTTEVPGPGK